jgi:ankyrin repeat protein
MLFCDLDGFEKDELDFAVDDVGNTLLHLAVHNGDKTMVQLLLNAKGLDEKSTNKFGQNAIHIACQKGDIDLMRLLVKKGIYLLTDNRELHPLHFAALNDNKAMFEFILEDEECMK